jgi:hypothetical protein
MGTADAYELATEAMFRIKTHEEVCEQRHMRLDEQIEALARNNAQEHATMNTAIEKISTRLFNAMVWVVLALASGNAGLIVYLWTQTHP